MDFERLLKNIIKFAAVALTSPATLEVAGKLYGEHPIYRGFVQIAALILVEGALLLGWYQLDNNRQATMPQRVLYAALTGIAYVALWSIAIAHGEGAAGITFRLTLGVLLSYSVFESGILGNLRIKRATERDPYKYPKVKRAKKQAAIRVATKQIEINELAKMETITAEPSANARKDTPQKVSAKTTRIVKRRGSRIDTDTLPERIADKLVAYPSATNKEIAKMLKISESTLYKYMPETNGHKHDEAEVG